MAVSTTGAGLTIFLTGEVNAQQLARIRSAAPAADVRYFDTQDELEREIELADIVGGPISPPALARAKRLKWVQSWLAGTNRLLFPDDTLLESDFLTKDGFIWKLNSSGDTVFAKKFGQSGAENVRALAVDGSGIRIMSDSLMPFQPAIDEPSNILPSTKKSSSTMRVGMVTCCSFPRVSVKRRSQ